MSQMSRFRAQSGPSSKSFVALSTKLAAVMLLRYSWCTKICTQKKPPQKKNLSSNSSSPIPLATTSHNLPSSCQVAANTHHSHARRRALSHRHTHSLSSFSLATRRPPDGAVANCRPADGTVTSESDRERSWGNFLRGNEGERDCPNAWTTHSVQDKTTTYILITYFPSRGTIWGVGNFCALSVPLKVYSTLIPLLMSWRKKASWDFQN
jgi:hypothetical protein